MPRAPFLTLPDVKAEPTPSKKPTTHADKSPLGFPFLDDVFRKSAGEQDATLRESLKESFKRKLKDVPSFWP